ncbi:DNA-binding SARP family transcriptional activator/Tfp pilus assembly protein PilF [Streptacidiphilus sp. MAP12-20]|uniref:AfsR/SARP family transcriptional regulator n=1 Tax=Streptacidiphilus sp. MAP12-20 TaxID=3156299 RepID=UPI0035186E2C
MAESTTAQPSGVDGPGLNAGLNFHILGPLEVRAGGSPVRIAPGRQETMLAALLLDANRVVSMDHLIDLIWDECPPNTARTQVQICVSRLRKVLTDAGIDAPIDTRPPGYLMRVARDVLDLHVFTRHVHQSQILAREGRAAEAAGLLREATSLWRGPALSGIPSEDLRAKATRLEENRTAAVETYIDLELALGRHRELIGEIGQHLHEHPLREQLRRQYMLALYRSGRQSEALAAYRDGRDLLADELGLDPGEQLRALEAAILAGDPKLLLAAEPAARAAVAVLAAPTAGGAGGAVEAGEADRARVAAADSVGPAGEPAPTLTGPVLAGDKPRQLPTDAADYIGGEPLVAGVKAVLADGSTAARVVMIVGRPGIGKSAAATHIGHQLGDAYAPDGQLYCDLRGTGSNPVSPREVLGRFLRALGIPGLMIPDSLDERAETYRTILATRRVLVVLDDAASESQVGPLIPGAGRSVVIVTSRTRLTGLPRPHWIELDILDPPSALKLLGQVIGAHRVAGEREAALALARTVGGLPLALRIVAARLAARPHWSLASMVERLANERRRLDELAHGDMTVRASLSLTHDGLGWADRRLLRLLSLAQGPTLPGWLAGALLDDHRSQPSDLMEGLVDVQMLDVVGMSPRGEVQYRLHEIVRMFARDELEAAETADGRREAVERMVGGWLAIAERVHRAVYGGDYTILRGTATRWQPPERYVDQLVADPLEWMDSEHVNLCQAVGDAAQAGLDEPCWELATTLVTLFEARGYHDLWESTHLQALTAARRAENRRATAALLASLGTLYLTRRQGDQARTTLESALRLFDELGDSHGLALCWRDLALLERNGGDIERAAALYERSLRAFTQAGDIVGKATVLTQSAQIWMQRGDGGGARARLEEALAIYRAVGYAGGEARALRRVGQLLLQRGETEQAERTLSDVLAMVRKSGDLIGEGHLLMGLGEVSIRLGRFGQARVQFERALVIRDEIMDPAGAALARIELARLSVGQGDPGGAAALLEDAITALRERSMGRELRDAEQLLKRIGAGAADLPE